MMKMKPLKMTYRVMNPQFTSWSQKSVETLVTFGFTLVTHRCLLCYYYVVNTDLRFRHCFNSQQVGRRPGGHILPSCGGVASRTLRLPHSSFYVRIWPNTPIAEKETSPFNKSVVFSAEDRATDAPLAGNQLICDQCFCYICDKLASSVCDQSLSCPQQNQFILFCFLNPQCCINVVYPSVCIVVSGWRLSLQQPQEKQLLEQPQGQHGAGRSAGFQPHRVWSGRASASCRCHMTEPPGASCPHPEGCCMFKFALIFCRENAADLQKRGICKVFYIPEGTVADGIWTQRSTTKTPYSRVSDEFDDSGSQGYAVPFFTKPSCLAVTHPCMNLYHRSWMKLINRMTELPPSWDSEPQRCLSDMSTVRGT